MTTALPIESGGHEQYPPKHDAREYTNSAAMQTNLFNGQRGNGSAKSNTLVSQPGKAIDSDR
jgi:hypothetical protein